jgi:hypothetical protein
MARTVARLVATTLIAVSALSAGAETAAQKKTVRHRTKHSSRVSMVPGVSDATSAAPGSTTNGKPTAHPARSTTAAPPAAPKGRATSPKKRPTTTKPR